MKDVEGNNRVIKMSEFNSIESMHAEKMDKNQSFDVQIPIMDSSLLFSKSNEIAIRHAGCVYRLRITKNNKLIMTK